MQAVDEIRISEQVSPDRISIRYVPLSQALEWDWIENPKLHDIGGLIQSIEQYGFRDPPEYDATLGAFAQGNGRVKALAMMAAKIGSSPPLSVGMLDNGEWAVPVIFGADSDSAAAAMAYAIDANNLVLTGGDTELGSLLALYDREQLSEVVARIGEADLELATLNGHSMDIAAGWAGDEVDKSELTRWTFLVNFEAPIELMEELEGLIGPYFQAKSRRMIMPAFFTAMVRRYCADEQPVMVE